MQTKNIIKHFCLITHHKWVIFKLCCKLGLYWRGLIHDLSKYSWTEFSESIKYYQGNRSPIMAAKEDKGYSEAWLHHKGRNKHHFEYWYDIDAKEPPIIPFKYSVEMICDKLAAGMVYQGKNWTKEFELKYWNEKEKDKPIINEQMREFVTEVFTDVSIEGIDKVISKKNLRRIYDKYCK